MVQAWCADWWADKGFMDSLGAPDAHSMPPKVLHDSANLLKALLLPPCAASVTNVPPGVLCNRHTVPRSLLSDLAARILN